MGWNTGTAWTAEDIATVKRLWGGRMTAKQIGAALRPPRSGNAVIGCMHREGLSRAGGQGQATKRLTKPAVKRTPRPKPAPAAARPSTPGQPQRPMPIPPPAATDVARVSFADLDHHHCKWPVGEPGTPAFGFCGSERVMGKPYCEGHCRRAYTSASVARQYYAAALPRMRGLIKADVAAVEDAKEFTEA